MSDAEPRPLIPPGRASRVRGRWQEPALATVTVTCIALAVVGVALPGQAGRVVAWAAIALVVATPLARVAWLGLRWTQERDWLFVALAAALLAVVAAGAAIALAT